MSSKALSVALSPVDNARLAVLCGPLDEHLRQIEAAFDVEIVRRGENFSIHGALGQARRAGDALTLFYEKAANGLAIDDIQLGLVELLSTHQASQPAPALLTRKSDLKGRTPNQAQYLRQIQ